MRCDKCKQVYRVEAGKDNFICSGNSEKGTKYKGDTVWLCLKGEISKAYLEMTPKEAKYIISALNEATT